MKRASEVPPEVESSGVTPVSAATARATRSVKGPGAVRKLSPEMLEAGGDADAELGRGAVGLLLDPVGEARAGVGVVEADVDGGPRLGRDDVRGRVADVDRW